MAPVVSEKAASSSSVSAATCNGTATPLSGSETSIDPRDWDDMPTTERASDRASTDTAKSRPAATSAVAKIMTAMARVVEAARCKPDPPVAG